MDAEKIKNLDGALLNLFTSAELWIAVSAIAFFFIVMHVKRILDARSTRMFGRQRFNSQTDIAVGLVYWFSNAIGADPWVLMSINNDYMRFEDKTRVRHIPTKNFPNLEWTISKDLSSADVLSGAYKLKVVDAVIVNSLIDKLDKLDNNVVNPVSIETKIKDDSS